jgi:hypothetical protein
LTDHNDTTEPAASARRLLGTLIGLANDEHRVRGISSRAIAKTAGIENHRDVTTLAHLLHARGHIEFTPGNFRTAHEFLVTTTVSPKLADQLRTAARAALHDALRRVPANAAPAASA